MAGVQLSPLILLVKNKIIQEKKANQSDDNRANFIVREGNTKWCAWEECEAMATVEECLFHKLP